VIWAVAISLQNNSIKRDHVMEKLKIYGIDSRPGFYTPHQLGLYNQDLNFSDFPNANTISSSVIVLPSYPTLANNGIEYISNKIKDILYKNG
jgi:dTDP-4-amino-4,6-dideoxygalactose transaminase